MVELCRNVNGLVKSVFGINGEMVMGKLVQNIYEGAIQVSKTGFMSRKWYSKALGKLGTNQSATQKIANLRPSPIA